MMTTFAIQPTTHTQRTPNKVPKDVLLHLFIDCCLPTQAYVNASRVCKQWHDVLHHPSMGEKFFKILTQLHLIPTRSETMNKDGWDLLRDSYLSKCELYINVSHSMIIAPTYSTATPLDIAYDKAKEFLSRYLPFMKEISLYYYSHWLYKITKLTYKDLIDGEVYLEFPTAGIIGVQNPSHLTMRFLTYADNESSKMGECTTTFCFISDFDYTAGENMAVINAIRYINTTYRQFQNVSLIFIEAASAPSGRFQIPFKQLLSEEKLSCVQFIELPQ